MHRLDLAELYVQEILSHFGQFEPAVLLYGSSIYGKDTSDLDVCTILHHYDEADKRLISNITLEFHKKHGLRIDDEVPFTEKCIYSYYELEDISLKSPFQQIRGKYRIPSIRKTADFLSSKEIKYRLLLNILTSDTKVIYGNKLIIEAYQKQAWEVLIKVIFSYLENTALTEAEFVNQLCEDSLTGATGKLFLGYEKNNISLVDFLKRSTHAQFERLCVNRKLLKTGEGKFLANLGWLNSSNNQEGILKPSHNYDLKKYPKMNGIDFAENANPFGPPVGAVNAFNECAQYIDIYPDYKNIDANRDLARFLQTSEENTAVCNGSLEAIFAVPQLVNHTFSTIVTPTYWGYEAALKAISANYQKIGLDENLEFSEPAIRAAAAKSDILFLCNPNNPTSSYISRDKIFNIVRDNPNCHFIIDESHLLLHKAYGQETLSRDVEALGNITLVYSLSKFFSVAGLRVGALVSNKEIVQKFKGWQVPYSLNTISQVLLPVCLYDNEFIDYTREHIHILVQELCEELKSFEWLKIKPTTTNFVLCEITANISAIDLAERLRSDGLFIRELKTSYPDLQGEWIRISVHTKEMNNKLINCLKGYQI